MADETVLLTGVERISIPTVERFWGLLAGVADEFSAV